MVALGRRRQRRQGGRLTAMGVWALALILAPLDAQAQQDVRWRFGADPQADLWFHGLAVVGFDRPGRLPLYDPDYAPAVAAARRELDRGTTRLATDRLELLDRFTTDPAFEVLHFVPLYLSGMPVESALDALGALASGGHEHHEHDRHRTSESVENVGMVLARPHHREALGFFLDALREEREVLGQIQPAGLDPVESGLVALWDELAEGGLGAFLREEGFIRGEVLLTPALGSEGRFLARDRGPLVVVGASAGSDVRGVAGAVVRELCYPAVRRALEPFESGLRERQTAAGISDEAATRCGEVLLAAHAPDLVVAYRDRFGIVGREGRFLSSAGFGPAVVAFERQLEEALVRELNLNRGSDRNDFRPAGR